LPAFSFSRLIACGPFDFDFDFVLGLSSHLSCSLFENSRQFSNLKRTNGRDSTKVLPATKGPSIDHHWRKSSTASVLAL
jgi:hypothetical protein